METYTLDLKDRPVQVVNLEGQELDVNWGVEDFIHSVQRFDGSVVSNSYDGSGRLIAQRYPGSTSAYAYVANGLLLTAANEAGIVSNAYDGANRLVTAVCAAPSGTVTYTHDAAGQVSRMTCLADSVRYQYDEASRLTDIDWLDYVAEIRVPEFTSQTAYTYDPYNGLVAHMTHTLSGLVAGYGYDVMDRLTNLVWRDASGSVLRGFGYSYDAAGMITQKVTTAGGNLTAETYAYDGLDRLVAVTVCSTTTSYSYDLAGNRTQMVENGVASTYVLGQANRLASWGPAGTNCTTAFDAAGCVTSMTLAAGRRLDLEWNGRYEMTAVRTNGVVAERHGFDALGRRAWTASGGETNWYVYDGIHVVADVDATGGVVRSYVWGPGIDNLLAIVVPGGPGATPAVFCALTDHLGTVHALADETGAVVESYCYDAWGRVLGVYDGSGQPLDNSAIGNRYLFQGREYSWATGLYYFRARGYDPMTGRWLSSDPIGISGGLNQYAFCDGDPLGQADPLGLRVIIYPPSLDGFSPANQAAAMQLHAQLKAGWNRMLNGGGTPTLTSIARALHQTPDVTIHVRVCELGYQGEVLPDGYPPDICMLVGLGGMEPIETFVHEMVHVIELMADRTPRSPLLGNAGVQRVLDALRKMSEDGSVRFGFSDTVGGGVPVKGGRLADTLAGALLGQMEAE